MPRRPREDAAGAIHHVFARGNGKQVIYRDDVDRQRYLLLLARVCRREQWWCLAYCLMHNHVHLLVETVRGQLGRGMQRLHGNYARTFNDRHARSGHLFQGRYGSVRVESDRQMWVVASYIAQNPVEAGLSRLPDEWTWSSHRATLDESGSEWLRVDRLLGHFEGPGRTRLERYAELTGTLELSGARAVTGTEGRRR